MQVVLSFPESEAAHVLALLTHHPAIRATPLEMDETEYLLSSPANARALLAAMERSKRGEYVIHDIDLDADV